MCIRDSPLSFLRSSIAQDILKSKYFLLFFDIFLLLFSDKVAKIRFVGAYFYGRGTLFILRAARGERGWNTAGVLPRAGTNGKGLARENAAETQKKQRANAVPVGIPSLSFLL